MLISKITLAFRFFAVYGDQKMTEILKLRQYPFLAKNDFPNWFTLVSRFFTVYGNQKMTKIFKLSEYCFFEYLHLITGHIIKQFFKD